jgi:hypothetical protein
MFTVTTKEIPMIKQLTEFDTVVVMLYNNDGADPEPSLAEMMNPVLPLLPAAK